MHEYFGSRITRGDTPRLLRSSHRAVEDKIAVKDVAAAPPADCVPRAVPAHSIVPFRTPTMWRESCHALLPIRQRNVLRLFSAFFASASRLDIFRSPRSQSRSIFTRLSRGLRRLICSPPLAPTPLPTSQGNSPPRRRRSKANPPAARRRVLFSAP